VCLAVSQRVLLDRYVSSLSATDAGQCHMLPSRLNDVNGDMLVVLSLSHMRGSAYRAQSLLLFLVCDLMDVIQTMTDAVMLVCG
jgi:hypothetical protein